MARTKKLNARAWLTSIIFLIVLQFPGYALAETITIVADEWCPYNCEENSDLPGFLIEIARLVFSAHGHSVRYIVMPWKRAVYEVEQGRFNAIAGALKNDAPGFVFPETENGFSQNGFFTNRPEWNYSGKKSLSGIIFGTVRGYSYGAAIDALINQGVLKTEEVGGKAPIRLNIEKLARGRINFLIEEKSVLAHHVKTVQLINPVRYAGTVDHGEPVFIAFSPKNPNSKKYAKLLSDGMKKIRQSGDLNAIMAKYGLKDWQQK